MGYADIHMHALFAVDDGPNSEKEMMQMIETAYRGGTRTICLTPHYHPGYFGDNSQSSYDVFSVLQENAGKMYPDLELYLGNELRYAPGCVSWLDDGACRTLGDSDYVLVDFPENVSIKTTVRGMEDLLNGGYLPVLAHAERYKSLRGNKQLLSQLKGKGVLIQMDAASVLGESGFLMKLWCRELLKARLVDIIASDAHGVEHRSPILDKCYHYIEKKFSAAYARKLFREIPEMLLCQKGDEKETEVIYE